MAKSDFDIQKESGQLWPDLLEWRAATVGPLTEERDKCKARADELLAFVNKCDQAIKGGASLEEVRSILDPLIEDQLTPEVEKEIAQLREEEAKYAALIAEIEAKIAELSNK